METQLRRKMHTISRTLVTRERLPGYHSLKVDKVLPQLVRAIQKIHEGSYGTCDDCSMQIPEERLSAASGAIRCLHCQQIFEQKLTMKLGRHL